MAPSSGYHMVPKAVRAVKYAISRSSDFVRARLGAGAAPSLEAVPAHARIASQQAIHPLALLRQSRARLSARQTRLFSTAVAHLGRLTGRTSAAGGSGAFHPSATRTALGRTTLAPFSSPLRPNLTGGALPRTAGGYGLGSGGIGAARHFSHTSSAQAHVVQNVHAAVRAFLLQGGRPLYDGTDPRTGNMRFRAVGTAEAKTRDTLAMKSKPWEQIRGTSLDFPLGPVLTALATTSPAAAVATPSLDESHVLPGLASDFARQLRELAAVYADLKKLRTLGSLPVSQPDATTLRVRFDGCDAAAVLALCDELGVTRGLIKEDPGWDGVEEDQEDDAHSRAAKHDRDVDMALLFPWAPTEHCASELSRLSSDGDAGVGAEQYFFARAPPPQRMRHFDNNTELEWRSMLSEYSTHSASPASAIRSPHAGGTVQSLPSVDVVSDADMGEPFDFESVHAPSSSAGLHGYALHRTATAATTIPNAPPMMDATITDYEGVEGIYRFLRELEGAGPRL